MSPASALDMVARAVAGFRQLWWLAIPSVLVAILVATTPWLSHKEARVLRGVLLVPCIAGALAWAWQLRWVCDDAFISFRYADNLVRGYGLVYNIGERVEGYTNFLWTLLLAGTASLGFDLPRTSLVLSSFSFVALLVLTSRLPSLADPTRPRLPIPLAAVACAAQYTMASFATSGLETMFGSLLALCALERGLRSRWFASGVAGVAAAMTHPDLGILYAALGAAMLLDLEARKHVVRYALPFVLIYLPYFAWRYHYYGDLFPNTYYAKSANLAYFSQGGVYLTAFLIGSGFWAALPLLGYGAWALRSTFLVRYCIITAPLFCVYIAKIGGDFMYGRLLCPIIPPLLVLGELAIARLLERRQHARAALAVLSLAVVAVPVRIIGPFEKTWQLADERTFYTLASIDPVRVHSGYFGWAETLLRYFPAHAPAPRLSMFSAGMISYYTGWPMLDAFGLTDRTVAHRPVTQRGRPGHEKRATPAYIVSRDVDISDEDTWPPPYNALARLMLGGTKFNLVHYDPKLLQPLRKKKGANFLNFEQHLTSQLKLPAMASNAEQIACDVWFAEAYYLARVPDSPLRPRAEALLLAAGRAFKTKTTGPPQPIDLSATRHLIADGSVHFEPPERARFTLTGDAFRRFPTQGVPPSQDWVTGYLGAYASTFDAEHGDAARGHLRSRPFELVGDVIELRVGGGSHSEQLRVSLLIDGTRVFSSGGCGSEMMGRRLWQIAAFKGQQAVLEIVDDSLTSHLMVDEIVQWSTAAP